MNLGQNDQPFDFFTYAERLAGLLAVVWGSWISLFSSQSTVSSYITLDSFIPLWLITGVFVLNGLSILVFPYFGWRRRYAHLVLFSFWLIVSLSFFTTDIASTGGIVYFTLALVSGGFFWALAHPSLVKII